jgi:hypothetical protein
MMNLTIEQLSKATKLSIPTLRAYTSQRNLGKRVGNRRVFTQADVQALLKGSRGASPRKARKAPPKRTAKREPVAATKPKPMDVAAAPVVAKPMKRSFLSRLFGGRKTTKKVSLMAVSTRK